MSMEFGKQLFWEITERIFSDSAMFVITGGNSGSNVTLTDDNPPANNAVGLYVEPSGPYHQRAMHTFEPIKELTNGPMNELNAIDDLLDSCIMYYYGVAHKYVIMVNYFHSTFVSPFELIHILIEIDR